MLVPPWRPTRHPGPGPDAVLPWWGWVLVWAGLLLGSAVFLGWLAGAGRRLGAADGRGCRARRLGGRPPVLAREVQRASELVAELERRADELRDLEQPGTAVTQPVHRMRAEYRGQRASTKAARRARRTDRLPPWARVH